MRTSNEVKISIAAARLACPEAKDETHFLPLPLFVPMAEFDPVDQYIGCSMSVRTKMLCDGKTRRKSGNLACVPVTRLTCLGRVLAVRPGEGTRSHANRKRH